MKPSIAEGWAEEYWNQIAGDIYEPEPGKMVSIETVYLAALQKFLEYAEKHERVGDGGWEFIRLSDLEAVFKKEEE